MATSRPLVTSRLERSSPNCSTLAHYDSLSKTLARRAKHRVGKKLKRAGQPETFWKQNGGRKPPNYFSSWTTLPTIVLRFPS